MQRTRHDLQVSKIHNIQLMTFRTGSENQVNNTCYIRIPQTIHMGEQSELQSKDIKPVLSQHMWPKSSLRTNEIKILKTTPTMA